MVILGRDSEVTTGDVGARKGILVVDVVPRINKRVVMCRLIGEDGVCRELVAVRVRNNVNYLPGMEIWDAYEEGDGVWVHPGKGPRRRGVW
jgi:hypothetical protein